MHAASQHVRVPRRRGPDGKHPAVAARLREQVISGKFKPGSRLPVVSALQAEFGTTKVTVLKAIGTLAEHGYLRTEERSGVFVADHPPHVARFAIAFPWGVQHPPSRFFQSIQAEAAKCQAPDRNISMFHDIQYASDSGEDSRRLRELVSNHRLAGLIFAHDPYRLGKSVITQEPGIPRVAIAVKHDGLDMPTVYPDLDGFMNRGLERLAARGRRRVGMIKLKRTNDIDIEIGDFERQCAVYGLETRPEWVHGFSLENAVWSKTVAQLLLRGEPTDRPDGLLIADDNFIEAVTSGVAASGVRVPEELDIVALTNFPYPVPSAVPVDRLGFDIRRLVTVCMDIIAQERGGGTTPRHTAIPALFEEETSQPPGAPGENGLVTGVHEAGRLIGLVGDPPGLVPVVKEVERGRVQPRLNVGLPRHKAGGRQRSYDQDLERT